MPLNNLPYTGQPLTTKDYLAQNIISAEVEKLCRKISAVWSLMIASPCCHLTCSSVPRVFYNLLNLEFWSASYMGFFLFGKTIS